MRKYFPFLTWLLHYDRSNLRGDLTAGLTVAVMVIPQSMAVAMLAGLPPIIGLYASVVPLLVYALFGTSRHLAVGPVALISLLVASGIGNLAEPGTEKYLMLATLLAAMVGLIQLSLGLFRFGFLVNFLSHPVISGFTSAAAIIITFSQLHHLLGLDMPRTHYLHEILIFILQNAEKINWPTVSVGLISLTMLSILKKWKPVFPRALLVGGVSAFLIWAADLEGAGVAIMGRVPAGLAGFQFPEFELKTLGSLFPIAVAISFVAFMESFAVAKKIASKHHYEVDANQELIGLGLANISAGLFGAYTVTGGFSRTAINVQSGARTAMASIITSAIIALTLLFLTNLFHYLPIATLAAIIILAVTDLIDTKEVAHLHKVKRSDLVSLLVTFVATLSLGIEKGILLSVAVSLILIVRRTTHPHYAILGRLPGTKIYRNINRYPEAITLLGLIMVRVDASLYFANVNFLKELISNLVANYKYNLSAVVFDASSINDIDSTADTALQEIADQLRAQKVNFYLTNVKGPVRDLFKRSGFYEKHGEDNFFFANHDAAKHYLDEKFDIRHEGPPGKNSKQLQLLSAEV